MKKSSIILILFAFTSFGAFAQEFPRCCGFEYPSQEDSIFYTTHNGSDENYSILYENLSREYLEKQIESGNFWEMEKAIAIAVHHNDSTFVPAISSLLSGQDELVVRWAAGALSHIDSYSSIQGLSAALLSYGRYRYDGTTIVKLLNSLQYQPHESTASVIERFLVSFEKNDRYHSASVLKKANLILELFEAYFGEEQDRENLLLENLKVVPRRQWTREMIRKETDRKKWVKLLRREFKGDDSPYILWFRKEMGETKFTNEQREIIMRIEAGPRFDGCY